MENEKPKNSEPQLPAVVGATYPGTVQGFARFLKKANQADADGYELVTLVKLEKKLAAVWRRRGDGKKVSEYSGFYGDDDEEPIPTYS